MKNAKFLAGAPKSPSMTDLIPPDRLNTPAPQTLDLLLTRMIAHEPHTPIFAMKVTDL